MAKKTTALPNISETLEYVDFTATQGGADAFVQATVATGLLARGESEIIYAVQGAFFEVTPALLTAITAATDLNVSITRASKAASVPLSDNDLVAIHRAAWSSHAANVNGAIQIMNGLIWMDIAGAPLIAGDNFYVQVDSTNFAAALTVTGRMIVQPQKRTKAQILEALYG